MRNAFKILFHLIIFTFLTAVTQVGGIVYGLVILFYRPREHRWLKRGVLFTFAYLALSLWGVPQLASYFGRVELPHNDQIRAQNYAYRLLNRHYVKPEVKLELEKIAGQVQKIEPSAVLVYLDANFPFLDGFPLLPHLSHNDGQKVDLTFFYRDEFDRLSAKKPSRSGYGVFESPRLGEFNQIEVCLNGGHKLYNKTSLLTLGTPNKQLTFDTQMNKKLLQLLSTNPQTEKIFIEPHLKHRLAVGSEKIRFQGCHAVRHDDHIHWQTR